MRRLVMVDMGLVWLDFYFNTDVKSPETNDDNNEKSHIALEYY